MTRGALALIGGNEFRRANDRVDGALLDLAGGADATVAIVPAAATNENPDVVGENGVRHFARLGAEAENLPIVDADSAGDALLAQRLSRHSVVYLGSGDPAYLLETLRGSLAWKAALELHERGGVIAGSGAGAMVCGEVMWNVDHWSAGLGLAPGVAVLPHHATLARRWDTQALRASLPVGVVLVGLDDNTALLLPEGRVVGPGLVTVYGRVASTAYSDGARVVLRLSLG